MGAAVDAVERALERAGHDALNAFITVDADGARERARALDARGDTDALPLHGRVLSVKDNLAYAGLPMTCGSRHLAKYVAPYTATVVARLESAGAVVLGKTNLDEFGCGSSGENSAFGPTRNPASPEHVPGGSSSGAAASVGGGMADLALGSDTGGSIRCPAAFSGLTALKPSYGRVSRYGMADLAMSLESPAPLARTVADVAAMMDAMSGSDARDAATEGAVAAAHADAVADAAPDGLRVGVVREFLDAADDAVARACRDAVARLEAKGAVVDEVSVPDVKHALATYYLLNFSEFASAMQRFDGFRYGTPGDGSTPAEATTAARGTLGAEVKRRVILGTLTTSEGERARWYEAARRTRARIAREFDAALQGRDVLVGPTMPFPAFRLGERVDDPLKLYAADVLTVNASLARLPAGSVPLRVDGLPVGFQVMGARGADATVLAAMRCVEQAAGVGA